MKKKNYRIFEKVMFFDVLSCDAFLGSSFNKKTLYKNDYFLGTRKKSIIYNIEKSFIVYVKALRLVRLFNYSKLNILFIKSPSLLDDFMLNFFKNLNHTYVTHTKVLYSITTNKKTAPSLIVNFDKETSFLNKKCLKKRIPTISFVNESYCLMRIDYPIVINLRSIGITKIYYVLVNHLI